MVPSDAAVATKRVQSLVVAAAAAAAATSGDVVSTSCMYVVLPLRALPSRQRQPPQSPRQGRPWCRSATSRTQAAVPERWPSSARHPVALVTASSAGAAAAAAAGAQVSTQLTAREVAWHGLAWLSVCLPLARTHVSSDKVRRWVCLRMLSNPFCEIAARAGLVEPTRKVEHKRISARSAYHRRLAV
eukprot:COSAG06_NODE_202_length_20343_cov_59.390931_14_plen_187_part_00